jgi:hypothetical protein
MLTTVEKILFIVLALGAFYFAGTGFYEVFKTIRRGKPEDRFDHLPERIGRAFWIVATQQSVFKKRPFVSFLHALVFYGFIFYFLVNAVDAVEGFFPFRARGAGWAPFNLAGDILTAGVLIGMIGLILRRFFVRPRDFSFAPNVPLHEDVARGGVRRDSMVVAAFILFHVCCRAPPSWRKMAPMRSSRWAPLFQRSSRISALARQWPPSMSSGGARWVRSSSFCPISRARSTFI